ncbi:MAG: hypothetical protein K2Y56_04290 [Methylobacterium sp.]|uniref:hypothetical protein n=1 Tax=Methylobacterium sp. TaxID=409 RepID=UPI0025E3505F|nr:hypothetical protein [Methylobacterium sp.]MBX9930746.1 hypothetical protein [Methylobacterium sp.]
MISALIHVERPGDPVAVDRLADTLAALVAGVAAGLVGDAVIVVPSHHPAIDTVAEATGATLVVHRRGTGPWTAGAEAARREWVLCLEAGDVPVEGWIRTLDRFIGTARPDIGLGRLRRPHAALPTRIAARGERVIGVRHPRAGDVVRRERLLAGPNLSPRLRPRKLSARLDHP